MDTVAQRIAKLVDDQCAGNKSDFARKINITPAYASQLCIGSRAPSDRTISDICREFHVNENWLRYGIGDPEAQVTQKQKLNHFFADVLSTAPDARSAFVASLDDLPDAFWPLVAELAQNIVAELNRNTPEEKED